MGCQTLSEELRQDISHHETYCVLIIWPTPWLSLHRTLKPSPKLKPTLPFCIHILPAYTVITTLTITMAIMATPTIISLAKEVLNNNPALGERLRLDLRLKLNPMQRLIHGIITIITMDIPIAISMGTMTTDITGMANRFKNSSV